RNFCRVNPRPLRGRRLLFLVWSGLVRQKTSFNRHGNAQGHFYRLGWRRFYLVRGVIPHVRRQLCGILALSGLPYQAMWDQWFVVLWELPAPPEHSRYLDAIWQEAFTSTLRHGWRNTG